MMNASVTSLRQWIFRALEVLIKEIPLYESDITRMTRLCREVEILLLDANVGPFSHAATDNNGCVCGHVQYTYRNCFIDIPPVRNNGTLLFPQPLLVLCPHNGVVNSVTFFHEVAHLFACGEYTSVEKGRYFHLSGIRTFEYTAAHVELLLMRQRGTMDENEVLTDITAAKILEGLNFKSEQFPRARNAKMEEMLGIFREKGLSRDTVISCYLRDSVEAKEILRDTLEA